MKQVIVEITVDVEDDRDPEEVAEEATSVLEGHFGSACLANFTPLDDEYEEMAQ